MIRSKDVVISKVYEKYIPFAKRVYSRDVYASKEDTKDFAHDALSKVLQELRKGRKFKDKNHLSNYICTIIINFYNDKISSEKNFSWEIFKIIENDILDWTALAGLFSDNNKNVDEKILWIKKFMIMKDCSEYDLSKDLRDVVKKKETKTKDN